MKKYKSGPVGHGTMNASLVAKYMPRREGSEASRGGAVERRMMLGRLGAGPANRAHLAPHRAEYCALVLSQVLHPPHCHVWRVHSGLVVDPHHSGLS